MNEASDEIRITRGRFMVHPAFIQRNHKMSRFEAYFWMLDKAAVAPKLASVGRGWVKLKQGQLTYSHRSLAEAWRWSRGEVGRFLDSLMNADLIRSEPASVHDRYDMQDQPTVNISAQLVITLIDLETAP